MEVSHRVASDSETLSEIQSTIDECETDGCDFYFYNGPCGMIKGYGCGYSKTHSYSVQNGAINISPYLHKIGEDLELVVEYVADTMTLGLTLIPAEAFTCMYHYALARFHNEGPYGPNQLLYESHFMTLNRLYNFRSINLLTEIYT